MSVMKQLSRYIFGQLFFKPAVRAFRPRFTGRIRAPQKTAGLLPGNTQARWQYRGELSQAGYAPVEELRGTGMHGWPASGIHLLYGSFVWSFTVSILKKVLIARGVSSDE